MRVFRALVLSLFALWPHARVEAMPLRQGTKSEGGIVDIRVRRLDEVKPTSTVAPPPATALSGKHRLLVVLVETADAPWPKGYDPSRYQELLFDRATSSAREYFRENSYGAFDLDGEVVGPVRVEGRMQDYAYTRSAPDGGRVRNLVERAVRAAGKETGLAAFDTHDTRGRPGQDGVIDHVLLVYAEATGRFDGFSPIWPHRGSSDIDVGGLRIQSYVILNHAARLGVYVHELGHDLGLPDLYDRDYSSHGVGDWCTMASGSWAKDAERPVHMSAWAKARLGWLTPQIIAKPTLNLKIPSSSERPFAVKIPIGEVDAHEYFLLENRRRVGFDSLIPAEGLLIWHVDEDRADNDDERRKLVDLVEASHEQDLDGLDENRRPNYALDVFSGAGKSTFDDDSDPSARAYDGARTKIRVRVSTPPERVMIVDIDRPEVFNPGGMPCTIAEDGYAFGRFASVPTGKGSEALMQLEATPGGFLAFAAEAFVAGTPSGEGRLTYTLYRDGSGQPREVLAKTTSRIKLPAEGYTWSRARLSVDGKGIEIPAHARVWLGVTSDDGKTYPVLNPFHTSKRGRWRKTAREAKLNDSFNFKEGPSPVQDFVVRLTGFGYLSGGDRPDPPRNDSDPRVSRLKAADRLAEQGQHAAAIQAYETVLSEMEKTPDAYETWIPVVVNAIGVSAYELKRYDVALERFECSLRRAVALGDERAVADIYENLGETSFYAGKLEDARSHVERSRVLNEKLTRKDRLVENEYWLGRASQELKDAPSASTHLAAALELVPKAFERDAKEEAEWSRRIKRAIAGSPEDAPGVKTRTEVLNDDAGKPKHKATYTDLLQFLSDDAAHED